MEIEKVDLHNSCRGCLSTGEDMESIFECFYNDIPLSQILMNCIPVVIAENDGLSAKLCELCMYKVTGFLEFQQMFINSEREIVEWLKTENVTEIEDPEEKSLKVEEDLISMIEIEETAIQPDKMLSSNKSLNYECEICTKKFVSPSKLIRHMKVHEKPYKETTSKKFECEICTKRFVCQAKVLRHMVIHDPERKAEFEIYKKTSQFTCNTCGKGFRTSSSLTSHEFLHSEEIVSSQLPPESLGKFTCIICLDPSDTSDELYDHIRKHYQEKEEKLYKCLLCAENQLENKFENLKAVIRHSKTHEENATHQCIFCENVRMGFGEEFIEHMKNHLLSNICSICNKTFTTRSNLTKHKLSVHEGVKKYNCEICNSQFTQSTSLKVHYRLHTGERPFNCENCEAKFNSSIDLKRHKSRKHSLNLIFCDFPGCNLEFRFISSLQYHMQTHQ